MVPMASVEQLREELMKSLNIEVAHPPRENPVPRQNARPPTGRIPSCPASYLDAPTPSRKRSTPSQYAGSWRMYDRARMERVRPLSARSGERPWRGPPATSPPRSGDRRMEVLLEICEGQGGGQVLDPRHFDSRHGIPHGTTPCVTSIRWQGCIESGSNTLNSFLARDSEVLGRIAG